MQQFVHSSVSCKTQCEAVYGYSHHIPGPNGTGQRIARNLADRKPLRLQRGCAANNKLLTHKGVNRHSKYVSQLQQQRPELLMVALTWHACKLNLLFIYIVLQVS